MSEKNFLRLNTFRTYVINPRTYYNGNVKLETSVLKQAGYTESKPTMVKQKIFQNKTVPLLRFTAILWNHKQHGKLLPHHRTISTANELMGT